MIRHARNKWPNAVWIVLIAGSALAIAARASLLNALLALAIAGVLIALSSRRPGVKALFVNLAAAIFALAAFEGYLSWRHHAGDGTRIEGTINEGYFIRHPVLGYGPAPGRQVSARKYYGDTLIYDVVYRIGSDGLRITPQPEVGDGVSCVVFFGDSITFGEGVNDAETMPSRVAALGEGRFRIYNFAFSGYGPHQMLVAIENNLLEDKISCRPTVFIYLTITAHIARVAGLTSWDKHGPRYVIDPSGKLVRDGNFDDSSRKYGKEDMALPQSVKDSHIYQRFFGRARSPDRQDLELYLAVLERTKFLVDSRYPDARFHVLIWPDEQEQRPKIALMASRLAAVGFVVHNGIDAVPEISANPERFRLSPHDQHPNPQGHRLAAQYVASAILGLPVAAPPPDASAAR